MRRLPEQPAGDRWFLVTASTVLVAILAGGGVFFYQRGKARANPPAAELPTPAAPVPGAELSFSGSVQAANVVVVSAPLDGAVDAVEVEVGAEVIEGQLLSRIRNHGLDRALQEATEDLERAQTRVNNLESALIAARLEASRASAEAERVRIEFDRLDKLARRESMLFKEGATPRLKFERAQKEAAAVRAEFEGARDVARQTADRVDSTNRDLDAARREQDHQNREIEGARADLQTAEVHAPVDGIVIAVKAKAGDEVVPGTTEMFAIAVDASRLFVTIEPDPQEQPRLKEGMTAIVQILELGAEGINGGIRKTDDGEWRVDFSAPDKAVKPGLTAVVKVKLP